MLHFSRSDSSFPRNQICILRKQTMIITSDRCTAKLKRLDIRRKFPWIWACVSLGMVVVTSVDASAQTQKDLPPPSELKKLSVEELMNIEVTSVSKRPEKLSE